MAIPTSEQVGAAIRATDDIEPWYAAFIAVCAFAGLRRGEASALKVSDVEFIRKEIRVQRQVQWTDDGQMEIRGPKYGSERTVYVPDALVTMLAELEPKIGFARCALGPYVCVARRLDLRLSCLLEIQVRTHVRLPALRKCYVDEFSHRVNQPASEVWWA